MLGQNLVRSRSGPKSSSEIEPPRQAADQMSRQCRSSTKRLVAVSFYQKRRPGNGTRWEHLPCSRFLDTAGEDMARTGIDGASGAPPQQLLLPVCQVYSHLFFSEDAHLMQSCPAFIPAGKFTTRRGEEAFVSGHVIFLRRYGSLSVDSHLHL